MAVVEADPVVRGQTASSSYKPGKLENGRRVMIPPYIEAGTRIVVNTADGSLCRAGQGLTFGAWINRYGHALAGHQCDGERRA